ncbi:MAG: nucleoside kinase [Oscillospiraceae bacterium]|nr:nucleoside kinase [Oscillospiraceae bacterium]
MKTLPLKELNKRLNADAAAELELAEELYLRQLEKAACAIAEGAKEKPIILLSGPSGSAKTSTAHRLKQLLGNIGVTAHVISLDNYFLPLNGLSSEELSRIDLEAPERLDLELLGEHLERFRECLPTQMPLFDFADQSRKSGRLFVRGENEPVILEGIHALNPKVMGGIGEHAVGLYVSVRTRLSADGMLLHPSMIRLMRRLMRDRLFRGRKTEDIIRSFRSVQNGEEKYIMPHKGNAEIDIDTFMSFEAAVYSCELLPFLQDVSPDFELYPMVEEMLGFLEQITPLSKEMVPERSIVREFVGGGFAVDG